MKKNISEWTLRLLYTSYSRNPFDLKKIKMWNKLPHGKLEKYKGWSVRWGFHLIDKANESGVKKFIWQIDGSSCSVLMKNRIDMQFQQRENPYLLMSDFNWINYHFETGKCFLTTLCHVKWTLPVWVVFAKEYISASIIPGKDCQSIPLHNPLTGTRNSNEILILVCNIVVT